MILYRMRSGITIIDNNRAIITPNWTFIDFDRNNGADLCMIMPEIIDEITNKRASKLSEYYKLAVVCNANLKPVELVKYGKSGYFDGVLSVSGMKSRCIPSPLVWIIAASSIFYLHGIQTRSTVVIGNRAGRITDIDGRDTAFVINISMNNNICKPGRKNTVRLSTIEREFDGADDEIYSITSPAPTLTEVANTPIPNFNIARENKHFIEMFEGAPPIKTDLHKIVRGCMVIMVGCPSSGKSTFAKSIPGTIPPSEMKMSSRASSVDELKEKLKKFVIISRDNLKSHSKCETVCKFAISNCYSVIIDNTNPDIASRSRYIDIAKRLGVPAYSVEMETERDAVQMLAKFREYMTCVKRIPEVAVAVFRKKYQKPTADEGFAECFNIKTSIKFNSAVEKKIFDLLE